MTVLSRGPESIEGLQRFLLGTMPALVVVMKTMDKVAAVLSSVPSFDSFALALGQVTPGCYSEVFGLPVHRVDVTTWAFQDGDPWSLLEAADRGQHFYFLQALKAAHLAGEG